MKIMERDKQILFHIIRYCDEIGETIATFGESEEIFTQKSWYRNAVSMAILQIGELANKLSDDFRENNPVIPWRLVIGMRNRFAHSYGSMNLSTIWQTAVESIPQLKQKCNEILCSCEKD